MDKQELIDVMRNKSGLPMSESIKNKIVAALEATE